MIIQYTDIIGNDWKINIYLKFCLPALLRVIMNCHNLATVVCHRALELTPVTLPVPPLMAFGSLLHIHTMIVFLWW